jgi:diguanylate cyclase (GGDEF)-like protein
MMSYAFFTLFLMQTNDLHHQYYKEVYLVRAAGVTFFQMERAWGFYLYAVLGLVITLVAESLLVRQGIRKGLRRGPTAAFAVIGTAIPVLTNTMRIFEIVPYGLDITPIALGFCCVIVSAGVLRHGADDLVPLAEEMILNNLSEGMLVVDNNGRLLYHNGASSRMLPELEGARSDRPLPAIPGMPPLEEVAGGSEFIFTHGEGEGLSYYRMLCRNLVVKGAVSGILLTIADATEHYKLLNQRMFDMLASREIDRARRSGRPISIVSYDLDGFKKINDTYGHPAGDIVLRAVTDALKARVRMRDVFARLGGDEFSILLPETDSVDIRTIAEDYRRILRELKVQLSSDGSPVGVTGSFGAVTFYDFEDVSVRDMIRCADKALYLSKKNGRDQVWFMTFPPEGDSAEDEDAELDHYDYGEDAEPSER